MNQCLARRPIAQEGTPVRGTVPRIVALRPCTVSTYTARPGRWWPSCWRPRISVVLAWRNLVHDRARFTVTLAGILFSVVLMAVQSGLLLGFARTASGLVDHTQADFWIASRGTRYVDKVAIGTEQRRFRALEVPGVASAENYIVSFIDWQRPDGGTELILIVGFDPKRGAGGPWNLTAGSVRDLEQPDSVIIDTLYRKKLGVERLGQAVEIKGHRARVVGFTSGIRTFTQSPYVFTSFNNALAYAGLAESQTKYVLVKVAPGADREQVRQELAKKLPNCDVFDGAALSRMTQVYWLFSTGAGITLVVAAALGLIVGIMIVSQTLYAATIDYLPQYATLRAMGASKGYLYRIIIKQAVLSAILGYLSGISIALLIGFATRNSNTAIHIPFELGIGLAITTVLMCCSAALFSIKKVTGIDPVSVFR
jgi:putative ABC transport system permease protein